MTNIINETTETFELTTHFDCSPFGERYLEAVNPYTFQTNQSGIVFYDIWQDSIFKEYHCYIFIGSDSGLLIEHIASHPLPKGSYYIFIEEENLLPIIESKKELTDIICSPQIHLCNINNWLNIAKEIKLSDYFYLNAAKLIPSLAISSPTYPPYFLFRGQVETAFHDLSRQYSSQLGSQVFTTNQLLNYADNQITASLLKKIAQGKTGVLLAGGPSLDDYLDWVKLHQDRLIIVAVSRISKRLKQVNLVPDIIATVDPYPISYQVSKECFYFQEKSILLYQYHTVPSLVQQWAGKKCYMGNLLPWQDKEAPIAIQTPGPTVTHAALSIMIAMGFKQIIMAGVDLCFSQSGFSHAKGSREFNAGPTLDKPTHIVTTNNNQQAETTMDYYQGARSLGQLAELAKKQKIQLINPAPFAVKVDNINHMNIKSIEMNNESIIDKSAMLSIIPLLTSEQRLSHYKRCQQQLDKTNYQLDNMITLAKQALNHNQKLFANHHNLNFKHRHKIEVIEKKLNKKHSELFQLIQSYGLRSFIPFFSLKNDEDESSQDLEKRGTIYYQAIINSCHKLKKLIKESDCILRLRIKEEINNSDMSPLIEYWQQDKHHGEALRWQRQHPNSKTNDIVKIAIKKIIADFWQEVDKEQEKITIKSPKEENISYWQNASYKLELAYSLKNESALNRLKKALSYYPQENSEAQSLLNTCQGCLAIINDNGNKTAEQYWQQAAMINQHNCTKELALKYLTTLDSLQVKEQALAELCQINDRYHGIYGRFLVLTKQHRQAIPHLITALKSKPHSLRYLQALKNCYQKTQQAPQTIIIEAQIQLLQA